jgi:hypothetical protein
MIVYTGNEPIIGIQHQLTYAEAIRILSHEPKLPPKIVDQIAIAVTTIAPIVNIDGVFVIAQGWKEAAHYLSLKFVYNNNPTGLGATNDGAEGMHAYSIYAGIAASFGHLLCYAATPDCLSSVQLAFSMLSPRRDVLEGKHGLGSAKTWNALNGKWAFPGAGYGQSIAGIASQMMNWI